MKHLAFAAALFALAGCAGVTQQAAPTAPVQKVALPCTADVVFAEGHAGRTYPANCTGNEALFEKYRIARRISSLEEEEAEINYLIASADGPRLIGGPYGPLYRGIGSRGYLISRRVEIKQEIRSLKRLAGIAL